MLFPALLVGLYAHGLCDHRYLHLERLHTDTHADLCYKPEYVVPGDYSIGNRWHNDALTAGNSSPVHLPAEEHTPKTLFRRDIEMEITGRCAEASTQFTALNQSDREVTRWDWDFGDNEKGSGQTISHTYSTAGDYEILLTVTFADGKTTEEKSTIHIYSKPQPGFTVNQNCSNRPIEFTDISASFEGNLISRNWLIQGAFYSTPKVMVEINTPGSHTILLHITSEYGCHAEVLQAITVESAPSPIFSADDSCEGELTQFFNETSNSGAGSIASTVWKFGDQNTSTAENPTHSYASAGRYRAELLVETTRGCKGSFTQEVIVHRLPEVELITQGVCLNELCPLKATSDSKEGEITSWFWNVADITYTDASPAVVFTHEGKSTIDLIVTTRHGCSTSITKDITVSALPLADFSLSPEIGQAPIEMQFINESSGAAVYHWDFGDGHQSREINPGHTYAANGTYRCRLEIQNQAGCKAIQEHEILVTEPLPDILIEWVTCNETPQGQQVTAKINNTGNIPIEKLILSYQLGGDAPVLEHWEGRLDRSSSMIYIFSAYLKTNGQQFPYICITAETSPLEMEEKNLTDNQYCKPLESVGLEIFPPYPNPGDDRMFIRFITPISGDLGLYIYDVKGAMVMEIQDENVPQGFHQYFLDISNLPEGPYKLQLLMGDKKGVVSFLKAKAH